MNSVNYWSFNKRYLLFYSYRIIFASILFFKLIPGVQPADALNFNNGIDSSYAAAVGGTSTRIVMFLNVYSNVIFGKYLSFLVTTSITSFVLVKMCEKINFHKRYYLLLIFSLPTFTLFSLGLTKEFFIISFIALFVIDTINRKYQLLFYVLFFLIMFIKPQVGVIVVFYFVFTTLQKLRNGTFDIRLLTVFLSLLIFVLVFFKVSDQLFDALKLLSAHFNDDSSATRGIVFFEDKYSYLTKAFIGFYYLVIGPTLLESINMKQGLIILLENMFIIGLILSNNKKFRNYAINKSRMYVFFSLFFVGFLVIYPSAVHNFVTAIRYRIPILMLLIYYFFYLTKAHGKENFTIY